MIYVQSGSESMQVNDQFQFVRTAQGRAWSGNNSWTLAGAVERNNFGHAVRRYTREEVMRDCNEIRWRNKNGTQRTFILDFDNGTFREWRSPYHWASKPAHSPQ